MLSALRMLVVAVALAALVAGLPRGAGTAGPEPVRAATTVQVCGTVNVYVKPTNLLPGALTVDLLSFVIAAGTSVPASVDEGASVCLRLTLNASGNITDIDVFDASATTTVKICGDVTAYAKATATALGSLTIAGQKLAIAYGVDLPSAIKVGADVCATLKLNVFAQIKDATTTANASSTVKVCGEVTAYTKATATSLGSLTIGGEKFAVAYGVELPTAVKAGADLCATLELNGFGQIKDATVTANASSTVKLCGEVTAYTKATATTLGSLTIGGEKFAIAYGVALPSEVKVGADLCASLELNAFGQIKDANVTANATTTVKVCGVVSAYVKATATSTGSITIGGERFVIAAGAELPAAAKLGADICATLELNASGQIKDGNVTVRATTTVKICGVVSAYAKATASSTGKLTIDGQTFVIAIAADLPAAVKVGADLCATLELNTLGQIQDGSVIANVTSTLEVCGEVTAYVKATATSNGSLTVSGTKKVISAGTSVDSRIAVGVFVNLRLELDAFGRISKVTVLKIGASLSSACGADSTSPSPSPTASPSATPSANPGPTGSPGASPGPTGSPGASPSPSASPSAPPTDLPGGSPEPTGSPGDSPQPTGSPDDSPQPTGSPGDSPAPSSSPSPADTPTPGGSPSPAPTGTPGDDGSSPAPNPQPTTPPDATQPPDEAGCPPAGDHDDPDAPAPNLPDTSTAERAGQLLITAGIPFLLFGLALIGWQLVWRQLGRRLDYETVEATDSSTEASE